MKSLVGWCCLDNHHGRKFLSNQENVTDHPFYNFRAWKMVDRHFVCYPKALIAGYWELKVVKGSVNNLSYKRRNFINLWFYKQKMMPAFWPCIPKWIKKSIKMKELNLPAFFLQRPYQSPWLLLSRVNTCSSIQTYGYLTDFFTILVLQSSPSIVFKLHEVCWTTKFEALIYRKGSVGFVAK